MRFPQPRRLPDALALVPSGRSLLVGFALLLAAGGAYLGARQSSLFAIDTIEVQGASPPLAARVRASLAPLEGTSLLALSGAEVERRVSALPETLSVRHDRAFPHTLRVVVRPERPVAVLRKDAQAWLVSARGRVIETLPPDVLPGLPRIWLPQAVDISLGETLSTDDGGRAVAAVAPVVGRGFPDRVRLVRASASELTLVLRSGLELRLGDGSDLRLKLAIARRILTTIIAPGYVDVSVPERPVTGQEPQVAG